MGYLADHDSESSSNTLDVSETEGKLLLTLDVGVEDTQYMLKIVSSFVYQTH